MRADVLPLRARSASNAPCAFSSSAIEKFADPTHARVRRAHGGRVSPRHVVMMCLAVVAMSASFAQAQGSAPPALPATAAGEVLRAWLDAYNSADSTRLRAYARRYEQDV